MINDFKKISNLVEKAILMGIFSICPRCAAKFTFYEKGMSIAGPEKLAAHKTGKFNSLFFIKGKHKLIENWLVDIEHGLFHGLCTFLVACCLLEDELQNLKLSKCNKETLTNYKVNYNDYKSNFSDYTFDLDELAASCFLHDILKCNGYKQEEHDIKLIEHFPNLIKSTYTHANPKSYKCPLVISDTLELKRYENHKSWYNPTNVNEFVSMDKIRLIDRFYKNIRPALEVLYKYRSSVWIRHGAEKSFDTNINRFPQYGVGRCMNIPIAIETDSFPFNEKISCFYHASGCVFTRIMGLMSIETLKDMGGNLYVKDNRDHFFANIPEAKFDDWVFVVNDFIRDYDKEPMLDYLVENNQKFITARLMRFFIKLLQVLDDRIKCYAALQNPYLAVELL